MGNLESHAYEAKSNILKAQQKLRDLAEFLDALAESEFLTEVLTLLREGPDVLSEKIASPIEVENIVLYDVESYGTQMAPFYTVLAQWVGALFCAVLLKTRMRPEDKPRRLTMPQHFFGRYVLFLFVGVTQALIVSAGDLWYIGILCEHPGHFIGACVMTGICFTMINYVLAFTLGAAGLAASVIIMVFQVGGAGGTYPVEVLPPIFQTLYPYMPFKFAMNAMRESISGFFGENFLWNIGWMLMIVGICIVFAFVIYLPGKWLNNLLEKAKKKTGIMI
jgi:putative membrane protein